MKHFLPIIMGLAHYHAFCHAGVIAIPLWLKAMLDEGSGGVDSLKIDVLDIFIKLLISFLVPTLFGKALRDFVPACKAFQAKYKKTLSLVSNSMLAFIIWQTLSSGRDIIVDTKSGTMLLVIVSTMLIHIFYLACNTIAVMILRIPLLEAIAAVIMASQKSAPVAVTVIAYMTSDTRTQGVLALPCVIGQLVQIFIGQPLAHYLAGIVSRHPTVEGGEV
jgi:solute carrier family 10 (sodium/bile acid cotransporter), member 7